MKTETKIDFRFSTALRFSILQKFQKTKHEPCERFHGLWWAGKREFLSENPYRNTNTIIKSKCQLRKLLLFYIIREKEH